MHFGAICPPRTQRRGAPGAFWRNLLLHGHRGERHMAHFGEICYHGFDFWWAYARPSIATAVVLPSVWLSVSAGKSPFCRNQRGRFRKQVSKLNFRFNKLVFPV